MSGMENHDDLDPLTQPLPGHIVERLARLFLFEEAAASVAIDLDSGVHTCYPGHDCRPAEELP